MSAASPTEVPVLIIDGATFDDFAGFLREFSALLTDFTWNGNVDALNDILRGGCGTPDDGFVLRWRNADRSREVLGWPATIECLEQKLRRCHPANREGVEAELEAARQHDGPTLFDLIVDVIREHGPGGTEAEDCVQLELC